MFGSHKHVWKEVHREFYERSFLSLGGSLLTIITFKCQVPGCIKYKQKNLEGRVREE